MKMFKTFWIKLRKKFWLKKKLQNQILSLKGNFYVLKGENLINKIQEVHSLIARGNEDTNFWTGFLSALEWIKTYENTKVQESDSDNIAPQI